MFSINFYVDTKFMQEYLKYISKVFRNRMIQPKVTVFEVRIQNSPPETDKE